MPKVAVDVLIQITYDFEKPEQTVIKTNARKEVLEELLSAWLQDQVGRGGGGDEFVERPAYTIKIGLGIADDTFCTESDTGNKGLTVGLIMDVLSRLGQIPVQPLS